MPCRIGVTTNLEQKITKLKAEGAIPQSASFFTIASGLSLFHLKEVYLMSLKLC